MYSVRIFLILLLTQICELAGFAFSPENEVLNFNHDWEFVKNIDTSVNAGLFVNGPGNIQWEKISLPHTANIEPLVTVQKQWQGTCFYRKFFTLPAGSEGKHIAIRIGAAMHEADVYLNGVHIAKHLGGYLPFYLDISEKVKIGPENCILIKLNNEDNPLIPPGKPIKDLDFNYYSGLYRNAELIIKEKLHITDPVSANTMAGGGIMVWYEHVSKESAIVCVKTEVRNDNVLPCNFTLKYIIGSNIVINTTAESLQTNVGSGESKTILQKLKIDNPDLWSPDNPNLYNLIVSIYSENNETDIEKIRIGIKKFSFSALDGFTINGKELKIRGTNRHQEYPYIGNALPDNAQFRDAWKIRQAGFNFVRCSHYPQSPSFLNACDELGILVMNSIPGWQFFGNGEFQSNSFQNIRDMLHRDRNHACIVLWETSLNETAMGHDYMVKANKTVHEELPYSDVYTSSWIDTISDVFIPARQHAKAPDYWKKYVKNKPVLLAEYGDWEYYAQNAGFKQTEFSDLKEKERSSRQLREYGQKRMAQQALNFQEAHNDNLSGNIVGDANWVMFDYNRGYAPDIESSGIMDIMRLPKFAFYFYQSQAGPNLNPNAKFDKPMVYIANYWSDSTYKNVTVYSNCEEVELLVNNKLLSRQKPLKGKYSENLVHAPFQFEIKSFQKGTISAAGFINGKVAAIDQRTTPGTPNGILLRIDESGKSLQSGCNDILFLYASVIDEKEGLIPDANNLISFNIEGEGTLIGQNPVKAEAGIATILIKAGMKPGVLKIRANAAKLKEKIIEVHVE